MFKDIWERAIVDPPVQSVRRQVWMYPSSASIRYRHPETNTLEVEGKCLRAEWYRIKQEPPTEQSDAPGILKMNAGDILQPLVEHYFKVAGLWRQSETSFFHEKMKLSGRVDFWLVDPTQTAGGREILVPCEVKSIGKYAEAGTCYPKSGRMMPKTDALLQVIPYLDHYSQFLPNTKIVLFYIGRDSMVLGEHHVWLAGAGEYGMAAKEDKRYIMVSNETGTYELKHLSVRGVYERYYELNRYKRSDEEPPPDYEDQWDNRRIKAYAEAGVEFGKLNKTEITKVKKALEKDPSQADDDSRPLIEKGDWPCRYCPWYTRCRTGLKHMKKPVFRDSGQDQLIPDEPPVVDDADTPI